MMRWLTIAAMPVLFACSNSVERFNGGQLTLARYDQLVAQCVQEYGQSARARTVCGCIVERYIADYPGQETRPPDAWAEKTRRTCGA